MAIWKYRASKNGEILAGLFTVPENSSDPCLTEICSIAKVRDRLVENGYIFIDAKELTKNEISVEMKIRKLKGFSRNKKLKTKRRKSNFKWYLLLCLLLSLLILLVIALHLNI